MTVYVDKAQHAFGRMVMCHMLADSLPELLAMADTIGIDRKWYQGFDKASCPHFDIAKSKRALAVQAGAVEVERGELAAVMRRIKDPVLANVGAPWPPEEWMP